MSFNETMLMLDADYFWFRAASAVQQELEFNQDLTVIVGSFSEGQRVIQEELGALCDRFETTKVLLTFTDTTNFRKQIDESYKGTRTKTKPAGYWKLKQWGLETYPSVMKPALEADDVMGILATNGSLENFVLVSPDKDLEQIPCRIYNTKEEFTQTPEAARRKLYEQCLTGDQSDNYPGAKGVGPVKATKILDAVDGDDYWPAVVEAYEKAGQTYEDALRNLRLAKILQADDWDSSKQCPILITP
jgi:DNA polymerase-1